ncbi:MAG: peptide-methionine (R)-S-oxide reductase [Vicingaceae bacterium]|nr:MAG: peptide-methionine (R)-S-oxide reductase [Vicingaceae bacterium]
MFFKKISGLLFMIFLSFAGCGQNNDYMEYDENYWKKKLSPEQYRVLRLKGTEPPFTGKYYKHFEKGTYVCAACGNLLFTSDAKFDSPCGWPSFDQFIHGSIETSIDFDLGYPRTEVHCSRCKGHLGHVFDDGPTETGLRYCINSVSIEFIPEKSTE